MTLTPLCRLEMKFLCQLAQFLYQLLLVFVFYLATLCWVPFYFDPGKTGIYLRYGNTGYGVSSPGPFLINNLFKTWLIWKVPIMKTVLLVKKYIRDFFIWACFSKFFFQYQILKIKIFQFSIDCHHSTLLTAEDIWF